MKKSNTILVIVTEKEVPSDLTRLLKDLTGSASKVIVVSELNLVRPGNDIDVTCHQFDYYRTPEMTLRVMAEKSDELLRHLRTIVKDRFQYCSQSVWVANETNMLHFHLLRLMDLVALFDRIMEEEFPNKVICVGGFNQIAKVAAVVATDKGVNFDVIQSQDLKDYLLAKFWPIQVLFTVHFPSLCLSVLYLFVRLRDLIRKTSVTSQGKYCRSNRTLKFTDVALLATNAKQSDVMIELYKHLSEEKKYICRLLHIGAASGSAISISNQQGLKEIHLADYHSSQISNSISRLLHRYYWESKSLLRDRAFCESFQLNGTSFWPLSGEYFYRLILAGLPKAMEYGEWMQAYLMEHSTKVVVTPAEWDLHSRCCVIAAKSMGVPSLSVQRGDITNFPGWGEPIFSDLMTVNGPAVKHAMVQSGVSPDRLFVTGDPRLDPWVTGAGAFFTRSWTFNQLKISSGKKIIAVMTNPVTINEKASHAQAYISALFESGKQIPGLHFVVKLHPSEWDIKFYRGIQEQVGVSNVSIIKDFNTPQLLFDASVVVTTISTTGEEAIFLGRPLIVVNLTNEPGFMPYEDGEAAITVRNHSDIHIALTRALYDERLLVMLANGRKKYIAEHLLSDDGQSAKRCSLVIRGLLKAKTPTHDVRRA